jgi:hypothetical protein
MLWNVIFSILVSLERILLLTINPQLIVQTALSVPEGKVDSAVRLLTPFEQTGDDAGAGMRPADCR